MKKLFILLLAVASLCCVSCSSNMKRANELIDEYTQEENSLYNEINGLDVFFTDEEWAYVEAEAKAREYQIIAVVGENWNLNVTEFKYDAVRQIAKAEKLRVNLSEEQRAFAQKYWDMRTYHATVAILKRWVEIHS